MDVERQHPNPAGAWQVVPPCSVLPGNLSNTHVMEYYTAIKKDEKMCMHLYRKTCTINY